jgi:hypothetical protein
MKRSPDQNRPINAGISLTPALKARLKSLPQVTQKEWSLSYLVQQVLANWVGEPADYDQADLDLIKQNHIVE